MAPDAVVFALANPDPEVDPAEADKYAAVVASGRSDYPNQINNVLAFPGVFRGLLDARAKEITLDMLLRAADAIAHVVTDDEINPNFIIPSVFNPAVPKAVAAAIRGRQPSDQPGGRLDRVTTLGDFTATSIDGDDVDLSTYDGQVVLVVNTASQCGLTPQYAGLQQLYDDLGDRGFTVLGFPCDQFGHQEPGTEAEIAEFCETSYGVTFPMFAKIDVNGDDAHPLYEWLKSQKKAGVLVGGKITWNFAKFLLGRDGQVIDRYKPLTEPADLREDIEKASLAEVV